MQVNDKFAILYKLDFETRQLIDNQKYPCHLRLIFVGKIKKNNNTPKVHDYLFYFKNTTYSFMKLRWKDTLKENVYKCNNVSHTCCTF